MVTYPYWIEHNENGNPINYVWVKVDNIPASSTKTIYAIKEPGHAPDGYSTFDFFDDFNDNSLASYWTKASATNNWWNPSSHNFGEVYQRLEDYYVSNSYAILYENAVSFSGSFILHARTYVHRGNSSYKTWGGFHIGTHSQGYYVLCNMNRSGIELSPETQPLSYGSNVISPDTWHDVQIKRIWNGSQTTFEMYVDGVQWDLGNYSNLDLTINPVYVGVVSSYYQYNYRYWDNIFVRKYTANEPTVTVTDMGSYYKVDIVNNETTTLTNYQIKVPISSLDISSVDESIEFTDTLQEQQETIYPYWIEHDENNNPINSVWVKIDSLPSGATKTIYVIKEPGYSPDGDLTFEFFDDFEGASLDTSKWTVFKQSNGVYSVSNSEVLLDPQDNSINAVALRSNQQFTTDFIIETTLRTNTDTYFDIGLITTSTILTSSWHITEADILGYSLVAQTMNKSGDGPMLFKRISGSRVTLCHPSTCGYYSGSYAVGEETLLRMYYSNSGYVVGELEYLSGNQFAHLDATDTTYLNDNKYIVLWQGEYSTGWGGESWWDWVRVRKYTANEPTVTVTDMGSCYKVDITNNETVDLTDYQVAIPVAELNVTSMDESIKFTDTNTASSTKRKNAIFYGTNA